MTMLRFILPLVIVTSALAQSADPKPLVEKAVIAVGGKDKLVRIFRMKEEFHSGDTPEPKGGKETPRESICEAPDHWWLGKKERGEEPAKFDVWGWTLGAITDAKSKIEALPDVADEGKPLFGLRVSDTVKPAMDLYFDKETNLLVRIDWRADTYRFSEWKDCDGVKYPSRCIIHKKATGKPWFYHRILELERMTELPPDIKRTVPVAK